MLTLCTSVHKDVMWTYADMAVTMGIESIHDLASAIKRRRLDLGLSQAEVAERAGVSREWVNSLEASKPTVELILVLRLLGALGLRINVTVPDPGETADGDSIDLDALLDDYRSR
jgi:HTH-type transcriptional regulator/antitoxin HipB